MAFLPCPFCGSDNLVYDVYGIECSCGATVYNNRDGSIDELEKRWNARADLYKAVADEREECAKLCESMHDQLIEGARIAKIDGDDIASEYYTDLSVESTRCAKAIRNRGKT